MHKNTKPYFLECLDTGAKDYVHTTVAAITFFADIENHIEGGEVEVETWDDVNKYISYYILNNKGVRV